MNKDFLNWSLTNRLHNLGYTGNTLMWIDDEEDIINDDTAEFIGGQPAILYSAAFRWFRDKYKLYHVIHQFEHKKGTNQEFLAEAPENMEYFKSYEECEVFCLTKLCELVENKNK